MANQKSQKTQKFSGVIVQKHGTYYLKNKQGELIDILQNEENLKLCESGDLCVFQLLSKNSIAQLVEVVGKCGDPMVEGYAIAKSYDLINEPTIEVKKELSSIPMTVTKNQIEGVSDLRDIPFVTIDPDTAKDYDDAVFACKNSDGTYTLKVAIANVASYIDPNSALFDYAMQGGNSTYLGDTCYPMLPEELSNGICSLNEKVDRLVFCTTCTLKPTGELISYTIEPAVINSKHRLTYKEADYLYFGKNSENDKKDHSGLEDKTQDVKNSIDSLLDVANILYKARMERGAFDIDSIKLSFKLNSNGTDVIGYEKDHNEVFTSVIEETAILTNEIWGEVAQKFQIPFFYRNHQQIDDGNIVELRNKLKQFNINIPKKVTSKDLQEVINSVKGKRIEEYIVGSILKSMNAAYYDVNNIGHAGLAIAPVEIKSYQQLKKLKEVNVDDIVNSARRNYFTQTGRVNGLSFDGDITHCAYAQTTSPIRRGSDLVDQIQMLEFINNGKYMFKTRDLVEHCDRLNFCENNATMAEKEYDEMLSAKWASKNIGKEFANCTVVSLGEGSARVVAPDGYRMYLPYEVLGAKKKFLKIGSRLNNVAISNVSICPPRVTCSSVRSNLIEQEDEKENC